MPHPSIQDLIDESVEYIEDPSAKEKTILKYFNQCLFRVASRISISDLDAIGVVDTTASTQTASTISFVNSSPATIVDSGDGFITAGHSAGSTITVNPEDDDDTVVNEGTYTIASVVAGTITLITGDTFTDESEGTSITLNSYANKVDLPSDFHRNIYKCYSLTHEVFVPVAKNRRLIDRRLSYQDSTGDVLAVAQIGTKLYYQEIPITQERLRLYYYKKPTDLTPNYSSDDEEYPIYIPDGIIGPLLVHYACYKIFASIEDGLEGEKFNTRFHKQEYNEALADLYSHFGVEQKEPEELPNEFNFGVHQ